MEFHQENGETGITTNRRCHMLAKRLLFQPESGYLFLKRGSLAGQLLTAAAPDSAVLTFVEQQWLSGQCHD